MHPYLAQAVAAQRAADLRREADAYRRARDLDVTPAKRAARRAGKPRAGQRSAAPVAARHGAVQQPSLRAGAHHGAEEVLVGPGGPADKTESTELCTAGC